MAPGHVHRSGGQFAIVVIVVEVDWVVVVVVVSVVAVVAVVDVEPSSSAPEPEPEPEPEPKLGSGLEPPVCNIRSEKTKNIFFMSKEREDR